MGGMDRYWIMHIIEPQFKIQLGLQLLHPKMRKILSGSCIKIKQKITSVVMKQLYSLQIST